MFAHSAAEDDHTGLFGLDGHIVQPAYILHDVDIELRVGLVRVEIDHVAQTTVCQSGAKDRNVVLSQELQTSNPRAAKVES